MMISVFLGRGGWQATKDHGFDGSVICRDVFFLIRI